MNEDTLLKSRTAWAGVIGIAGTQLDAFKALPTTLQLGIIAIVCTYIAGRALTSAATAISKALVAAKKLP